MDLLGDVGHADQLTSARAENTVLQAKVKELTAKVKELQLENKTLLIRNEALLAEVEEYRKQAVLPSFSKMALGGEGKVPEGAEDQAMDVDGNDKFIMSGNGVFPTDPAVTLPRLHGDSNPLCCALHPDDAFLATGGADGYLSLVQWGRALAPSPTAAADTVQSAIRVACGAPVICTAFSQEGRGRALSLVAAGCMDGSLHFATLEGTKVVEAATSSPTMKHGKYIKSLAWSPSAPIVASASADGTVFLTKVVRNSMNNDNESWNVERVHTLHLEKPVETLCFVEDGNKLCLYVRDTTYLCYFDLRDECKLTKQTLNTDTTGGFEDHVSFAVMSLHLSLDGKYLVAGTDSNRNIVIEMGTSRQIRNLYGHKNDPFSQPRAVWSRSGQYVIGNSQDDTSLCVWDVASSTIVRRLDDKAGGHTGNVRDIYSSRHSDTVVTASYDKTVKIWLTA